MVATVARDDRVARSILFGDARVPQAKQMAAVGEREAAVGIAMAVGNRRRRRRSVFLCDWRTIAESFVFVFVFVFSPLSPQQALNWRKKPNPLVFFPSHKSTLSSSLLCGCVLTNGNTI